MKERFNSIPTLPGCLASNLGRIALRNGRKLEIVKQHNRVRGYLGVALFINGEWKRFLVNRLVLMAFAGLPPSEAHEALHRNNERRDNRISNLKWGTHAENMRPDVGNNHSHKGESNPNRKLSLSQIGEIRTAFLNKRGNAYGMKGFAARFGITTTQVSRIANRRNGGWKNT